MNFLISLEIDDFIQLIQKSFEKREEHKAWKMWLMRYQHMDEQSFIPFSQFFKSQKQPSISQRSTADILNDALEIRLKIKKKHADQ